MNQFESVDLFQEKDAILYHKTVHWGKKVKKAKATVFRAENVVIDDKGYFPKKFLDIAVMNSKSLKTLKVKCDADKLVRYLSLRYYPGVELTISSKKPGKFTDLLNRSIRYDRPRSHIEKKGKYIRLSYSRFTKIPSYHGPCDTSINKLNLINVITKPKRQNNYLFVLGQNTNLEKGTSNGDPIRIWTYKHNHDDYPVKQYPLKELTLDKKTVYFFMKNRRIFPNLESLHIWQPKLQDACYISLLEEVSLKKLALLDVNLSEYSWDEIMNFVNNQRKNIRSLKIEGSEICCMRLCALVTKCPQLEELEIDQRYYGDSAMIRTGSFNNPNPWNNLKTLKLYSWCQSEAVMTSAWIKFLRFTPKLKDLHIEGVKSSAWLSIVESVGLVSLRILRLRLSDISKPTVDTFKKTLIRIPTLEELHLFSTRMHVQQLRDHFQCYNVKIIQGVTLLERVHMEQERRGQELREVTSMPVMTDAFRKEEQSKQRALDAIHSLYD